MSSIQFNSCSEYNKTLIEILCHQKLGFHVVHFNARSLKKEKLDYVRYLFEFSEIDFETWFQNDVPDIYFDLQGYNIFRNDRMGRAVYVKKNLSAKIVSKSTELVEYIDLEIGDSNTKTFFSCIYNPSRNTTIDNYFNSLSN